MFLLPVRMVSSLPSNPSHSVILFNEKESDYTINKFDYYTHKTCRPCVFIRTCPHVSYNNHFGFIRFISTHDDPLHSIEYSCRNSKNKPTKIKTKEKTKNDH